MTPRLFEGIGGFDDQAGGKVEQDQADAGARTCAGVCCAVNFTIAGTTVFAFYHPHRWSLNTNKPKLILRT
ncbi:unnamed protein product [Urochloa humidicola]